MGKIALGGAIPPDNNNGLGAHSQEFLDDYKPGQPLRIYNVVARVSVEDNEAGGARLVVAFRGVSAPLFRSALLTGVSDDH